jgi:hypothetical protein
MLRKTASAAIMAIALSFGLQGAIVVLGSLFGGIFGTPIPDGEAGGIGDLIGGFLSFSLLLFLANVACTSAPMFLLAARWSSLWLGRIAGLLLLSALLALGPVLLMLHGDELKPILIGLDLVVAMIAVWLASTWAREPNPRRV